MPILSHNCQTKKNVVCPIVPGFSSACTHIGTLDYIENRVHTIGTGGARVGVG